MKRLLIVAPLVLIGIVTGCSSRNVDSAATPDSNSFLAAVQKLPASQRVDYAKAHSADVQAIQQRGGPEAAELHDLLNQHS